MKLLTPKYLPRYRKAQKVDVRARLKALETDRLPKDFVALATVEGAVSSSQIEGSRVSLGKYTKAMLASGGPPRQRDLREVYDLVQAYKLAQRRKLNLPNLMKVHETLATTLLSGTNDRGAYRTKGIRVGNFWETVYVGPLPTQVPTLMEGLFDEVDELNGRKLTTADVFYYAALLHLRFVQVHPFADGNGRTARILEKWFLATHLGRTGWKVRSEMYYRLNLPAYYEALKMGRTWAGLDLDQCLPFLLLLPKALDMPLNAGIMEGNPA